MNRSFSPTVVRPNLPLRRPSTSPGGAPTAMLSPRHLTPPGPTPVRSPAASMGNGVLNSVTGSPKSILAASMSPAVKVNFCNFCGQQGNFRCTRCKKTSYCSVVCQSEDWTAHRHMCKSITPDPAKETPQEASPAVADRTNQSETKMSQDDASCLQKVFLKDLEMNKITKGEEIQATVFELHSPSRFFLLIQSPDVLDALHRMGIELQKTYSGCSAATAYTPSLEEICAVQFSRDLSWYRGLVQSMAADQKTANILYIDFGNEEDVPVDRIKPLAANIKPVPPCVLECSVAGVVPLTDTWTGECCLAVRQLVVGKTVTVSIVNTLENGRKQAVNILLPSMGKQLSTFLLDYGYAVKEVINQPVKPTKQDIDALENASLENFKRLSIGKDNNTWAQLPEPLTQALGDSFSVVVTHLQSPLDIICQKVENASVIQELQLKLREHCSQLPPVQNFRPAPGTACCAQFSEDNLWYRAKVLGYSSEERVCVGYIDFGNSEEMELSRLRPLNASLLALPMQAFPCALAGVQPVGETWSEECLLALQCRVSNRILRVEIVGGLDDKALVAVIDECSDPQANVAELLVSAGYAAAAAIPTPAPTPAPTSTQPAEQTTTAAGEAQVSSAVSGPACEPLVWSCTELPTDGQAVALLVSVVVSPDQFYCRIHNPKDHQMLIELGAELKKHCEADVSPFNPKVGEPCCAKFSGDGAWCRAMVKELVEDHVAVYFVDYGNSAQVLKSDLRAITPRLLTLPFQAVCCWLAGVLPWGSEWSSEALLWFQTLVDGRQLSACVLSVTERGYGVVLESGGQSVAAMLISKQQARAPGQTEDPSVPAPIGGHASTGTPAKNPESMMEKEQPPLQSQAPSPAGASAKDAPSEEPTVAAAPTAASFPVDWKTVELPHNETFQPCIAAVTSPSLFYVLNPSQVDVQKLQRVMMELAVYCNANQASASSSSSAIPTQSRPAPGAACCTRFSADNNWYRAVVLEADENEVSVMYADYGNTEKVPYSRILPIPLHLLELPFQITRCALSGKEHFPAVWPVEVLELFKALLSDGVLATVQSFDGSTNLLSVTLRTERGGGQLNAMVLDAVQAQAKSLPSPAPTPKADHGDNSTSGNTAAAAPDHPQPVSVAETHKEPESTAVTTPSPALPLRLTRTPQQKDKVEDVVQRLIEQMEPPCGAPCGGPPCGVNTKTADPPTSGCCCVDLKTKIDHLEQLMQLQLALIKLIAGQTKC